MSAATAPAATDAPTPKGGKKKLFIIIGAVLALVLVGGGVAVFMMQKKAAEAAAAAAAEEEGGDEEHSARPTKKAAAKDHSKENAGAPPTFVPLDPFTVNLADRDADRFAQIGMTLQVDDPKMADEFKMYMPAIRNAILLILSHKSSEELLSPEGKTKLADEVRRAAARAMGYEIEDPEPEDEASEDVDTEAPKKKKKKKKKKVEDFNPITQVHYATFIIQ